MAIDKEPKPYCKGCQNKTVVHLSHTAYGEIIELHLCESCPFIKEFHVAQALDFQNQPTGILGSIGNISKAAQQESLAKVNRIQKLLAIQKEMEEAIEKENYEYAAQLRDKYKRLKDDMHWPLIKNGWEAEDH
jgi:protein-arginine kinase activator protein McsA